MSLVVLSNSETLYNAWNNGCNNSGLTGGVRYNINMMGVIQAYEGWMDRRFVKRKSERMWEYAKRIRKYEVNEKLQILEPMVAAFIKQNNESRKIAILHHFDNALRYGLHRYLYTKYVIRKLQLCDRIVVVSPYWENLLQDHGIGNVVVIRNSYPRSYADNIVRDDSVFSELGLPRRETMVFGGKATSSKGFFQLCEHLSGDVFVIGTGQDQQRQTKWAVCDLDSLMYKRIVAACDITILNTNMIEGWSRVAHESLLLGTPVLARPMGGLMNMIKEGGQHSYNDYKEMNKKCRQIVEDRNKYSLLGKSAMAKYDMEYFRTSWEDVINCVNNP